MPLEKSLFGCQDDWNALDHFDPTANSRRIFGQFNYLRRVFGSLQDGFNLVQRGNWTYFIERPGSNGTATEMGLWSVSRAGIEGVQTLGGRFQDQVWLLFTNENSTQTYTFDCEKALWISSPYPANTVVRNLFAPYENYTLADSQSTFNNVSRVGCLPSVTMEPYGYKALVPLAQWVPPLPALTKFVPGHDHRLLVNPGDVNATTVDISFEFNTVMSCDSVTKSMSFNMSSSSKGGAPTVSNVNCGPVTNPDPPKIPGDAPSIWAWSATLQNFPDGVLTITLNNPSTGGNLATGVCYPNKPRPYITLIILQAIDHLLLRKGSLNNVMVFPESDYDNAGSFGFSDGQYTFAHKAYGADLFRYSWNFGQNWTKWNNWEDTTLIDSSIFKNTENFWPADHIVVQCSFIFIGFSA